MNKRLLMLAQAFAAAAVLTACGGGGSDTPPAPAPVAGPLDQVPDSASQSATGMVDYLDKLKAASSSADSRDPVDLGTYAPKTTDDTEPESLS